MKTELSDGERTLMTQLWEHPGSTITELTAAMRGETGWSKRTILFMPARMKTKSAIAYEQSGRGEGGFAMTDIPITSSVLIGVVFAARLAFRQTLSCRLRYALWGLVLLRLLLPVQLPSAGFSVLNGARTVQTQIVRFTDAAIFPTMPETAPLPYFTPLETRPTRLPRRPPATSRPVECSTSGSAQAART